MKYLNLKSNNSILQAKCYKSIKGKKSFMGLLNVFITFCVIDSQAQTLDYGDAPASYELNSVNAPRPARNEVSTNLHIGGIPDAEVAPNSVASGNDNNGTNGDGTDEDGLNSAALP